MKNWTYYSEAQTEECNQNDLYFYVEFDTFLPWTATYFLEVSAGFCQKYPQMVLLEERKPQKLATLMLLL